MWHSWPDAVSMPWTPANPTKCALQSFKIRTATKWCWPSSIRRNLLVEHAQRIGRAVVAGDGFALCFVLTPNTPPFFDQVRIHGCKCQPVFVFRGGAKRRQRSSNRRWAQKNLRGVALQAPPAVCTTRRRADGASDARPATGRVMHASFTVSDTMLTAPHGADSWQCPIRAHPPVAQACRYRRRRTFAQDIRGWRPGCICRWANAFFSPTSGVAADCVGLRPVLAWAQ